MEFRDPLGPAAKQFLPRLQSAFLVEAPEAAERLARENPSYSFLTPDGTCYQGRAVTGGRPTEAGPLGDEARAAHTGSGGVASGKQSDRGAVGLERMESRARSKPNSLSNR